MRRRVERRTREVGLAMACVHETLRMPIGCPGWISPGRALTPVRYGLSGVVGGTRSKRCAAVLSVTIAATLSRCSGDDGADGAAATKAHLVVCLSFD
jgi:hypothetical protein